MPAPVSLRAFVVLVLSLVTGPALAQAQSAPAGAGASGAKAQVVAPCYCKRYPTAAHFDKDDEAKARWVTYGAYRNWLQHAEILTFVGNSEGDQSFQGSLWNVTPEDDVFLRIIRPHPIVFGYSLKVSQADTAQTPLLVAGGEADFNPFKAPDPAKPAAEVKEQSKDAKAEVQKAAGEPDAAAALSPSALRSLIERGGMTTRAIDDGVRNLEAAAREVRRIGREELAQARAPLTTLTAALDKVTEEASAVEGQILEIRQSILAARLPCDDPRGLAALDCGGGSSFSKLRATAVTLRVSVASADAQLTIATERLTLAETSVNTAISQQASLRNLSETALREAVKTTFDQIARLRSDLALLRLRVTRLATAASEVEARVTAFIPELARLIEWGKEKDICLTLGRFQGGKTVTVEVSLVRREIEPKKDDRLEKAAQLAKALVEALKTPSDAAAAAGAANAVAAAVTAAGDAEEKAEEKKKEEKPAPPAPEHGPRVTRFDVLAKYHLQVAMGIALSTLRDPEYDSRSREIPSSDPNVKPTQKEITIFEKEHNRLQVIPTFQVGVFWGKGRYLYADEEDADPYESVRRWHRWVPFPTFGFDVSDVSNNFFLSGGLAPTRGMLLLFGAHFGRVDRLREAAKLNQPFAVPIADNYSLDYDLDRGFEPAFFFSVAVDAATIGKIFPKGK
jgi:hypothetical protein